MSLLNYPRHFALLAALSALLAAIHPWSDELGAVVSFGFYGALHASALAFTLRRPANVYRRLLFVAAGAALSMVSVTLAIAASRVGGVLPGMVKPALLLALSSGIGAASYAIVIGRWFGTEVTFTDVLTLAAGCIAATLAVLASSAYLLGGGVWFATFWWFAFSLGLWSRDRRRAAGVGIL